MHTSTRSDGKTRYIVDTGGGYTFDSAAEAETWETTAREYHGVVNVLPRGPLSRDAYEAACAEWQTPALSDADLNRMAYAIKYGEFVPPDYGRDVWVKMGLASARFTGITAEREAKPAPPRRQPTYPNGRQLDCGCIVYESAHVMSASTGSSCQDCYDRMSD